MLKGELCGAGFETELMASERDAAGWRVGVPSPGGRAEGLVSRTCTSSYPWLLLFFLNFDLGVLCGVLSSSYYCS